MEKPLKHHGSTTEAAREATCDRLTHGEPSAPRARATSVAAACSLTLLALAGCVPLPAEDAPLATEVASVGQEIIDGDECAAWVKDSTVAIGGPYPPPLQDTLKCTGTLIASNLVVTARHCVSTVNEGAPCNEEGQPNWVVYDPPIIQDLYIYSDFDECPLAKVVDAMTLPDDFDCNNDIVFLFLDRRITEKTTAAIRGTPAEADEILTMAGFGTTSSAGDLPETCQQREVPVTSAPPPADYAGPAYTIMDVNAQPLYQGDWEIATGAASCHGDSGGPLFDANHELVGTVSRGSSRCSG
jgi:hypothetical protein